MAEDSSSSLTPDEIEFTNAFNNQRGLLAGFAKCSNQEELQVVRDGLYLGLGHDICPQEYGPVQRDIVLTANVAEAAGTSDGFSKTIEAARKSTSWQALVDAVHSKASAVGSDLQSIWMKLERGRLEWLTAATAAHGIKVLLQQGLAKDNALDSPGDVSDAKMLWIYSLCLNINVCKPATLKWAQDVVQLPDPQIPLVGYQPDLWDSRKDEWRSLDVGAQVAAARGGSSIDEAWNAK